MYLLDTDTSIFLLNRKDPAAEQRLRHLNPREVSISTITMAELHYGAAHSKRREANKKWVKIFYSAMEVLPFDEKSALLFGTTKEHLMSRGEMIGTMDLLIASVVLATQAILVTHNTREFSRIPNLKCEGWFAG